MRTRAHSLRVRLHGHRDRIRARRSLNTTYRFVLGTFGTLVLIAGVLMIPYPGPGWLVVFAGLGILATEFHWAHRVNMFARRHYHRWIDWLHHQSVMVKLAVMSGTGVIVLGTLWLLGTFSLVGDLFGAHWPWLTSPLFEP